MALDCERDRVCGGIVRSWRCIVCDRSTSACRTKLELELHAGRHELNKQPYAFNNTSADTSERAFHFFVTRRTHDECTARIDRREERIAILEAMFKIAADLECLVDDPIEFAHLIKVDQHIFLAYFLSFRFVVGGRSTWVSEALSLSSAGETGGQIAMDIMNRCLAGRY